LSGEEIVVVGDTAHDVACGRAIQARVLAVATGGASWEELQVCAPDWLVADLERIDAMSVCPRERCGGPSYDEADVAKAGWQWRTRGSSSSITRV
jgi:hypothetical protein